MNLSWQVKCLFLTLYLTTLQPLDAQDRHDIIKGITVICPPDSFIIDPYKELVDLNANWTCITPYRSCSPSTFKIEKEDVFSWWGLSDEGVRQSIRKAKAAGLKVMLKPQLYLEKSWPGNIDFNTSEEWQTWEAQYLTFIRAYLLIAVEEKVDIFCLGTELKNSVIKRNDFWVQLIQEVRHTYVGKIIYSANWDAFENVRFWGALDFIGISAYFPISDQPQPDLNDLKKIWKPIANKLKRFAYKRGKKILFTEYGYLSVDGAAFRHWELEDKINTININEQAQASALEALYDTFWNEKTWAGGFLWKWYPDKSGHQGNFDKDYSPQGKLAERIINNWFNK